MIRPLLALLVLLPGCASQALWDWASEPVAARPSRAESTRAANGAAALRIWLAGRAGLPSGPFVLELPPDWRTLDRTADPRGRARLQPLIGLRLLPHDERPPLPGLHGHPALLRSGAEPLDWPAPEGQAGLLAMPSADGRRLRIWAWDGEWVQVGDAAVPEGRLRWRTPAAVIATPIAWLLDVLWIASLPITFGYRVGQLHGTGRAAPPTLWRKLGGWDRAVA